MEAVQAHRHGFVFGILMLCAAVLTAGFVFFPKGSIPVAEASQACPFSDGDGGTPGIQVTTSPSTIAAVPTPGDYYDCTASDVTIKTGVTVTLGSNTASGTYAEIHFANLTVESGASMDASGLGCADSTAEGNGYGPNGSNVCTASTAGAGSGAASTSGGGGGYAAPGGDGWNGPTGGTIYGNPAAPVLFGSSGGTGGYFGCGNYELGGAGGGVVRLDVSGTFTHDGTVKANGANGVNAFAGCIGAWYSGGGGSGGSVYITAATINGSTGTFEAKGGNGNDTGGGSHSGGGGGGGMISLVHDAGSYSYTTSALITTGGTANTGGVAGTKGDAYVNDNNGTSGDATDDVVNVFHGFLFTDADYVASSWTADASATSQLCTAATTTPSITAPTISLAGTLNCSPTNLTNFTLSSSTSVTFAGLTFTIPNQKFFNVSGGAALALTGSTTINGNVQWTSLASVNVGASSVVNANGYGCTDATGDWNGYGPNGSNVCTVSTAGYGAGADNTGGGGGAHGANGGSGWNGPAGGVTYEDPTAPVLFGSSGGTGGYAGCSHYVAGGAGGGVIRIDATGTMTNNGVIKANGNNGVSLFAGCIGNWYSGGGGSGGSIYVTASAIDGSTGTFEAKGGNGLDGGSAHSGGGGGGGMISLVHNTGSFSYTSSAFVPTGGTAAGGGSAGGLGVAYVNDDNGTTGTTTDDAVNIFHGFNYTDTDYSVSSWTTDSSATNQFCRSAATTPSITAPTISLAGTLNCSPTNLTNFTLSSSTSVTFAGLTFTIPNQKYFYVSGGAALTASGSTTINANVEWTGLASVNIGSSSIITANGFGCSGSATGHGKGPTSPGNVCTSATTGYGLGGDGSGGGGGYGGSGGSSYNGIPGGTTYGSSTGPLLYGSSGGTGGYAGCGSYMLGGAGGGVIRIGTSGAFTHNGTIRANGANGVNGFAGCIGSWYTGGGGSGGSVNLTSSSMSGTTGLVQALGGASIDSSGSSKSGGSGGGGRVYLGYNSSTASGSFALNAVADTIGGSGASVYAAAGSVGGGGSSGSAGTLVLEVIDAPPAITAVTHTPSNPTQTDAVTLSGTATDSVGVTSIQIYLDGTAPANLKKTCTQAAASPVTCTVDVGVLSYGSHTTTIRASDGTNTTDDTETFTVGGPTQSGSTTLSRLAAGATGTFTMSFAFQSGTHSGPLTVTFPSAFTLNSAPQGGSSSACLGSFAFDNTAKTLSATKTSCTGTITLGGASITNPGTPGSYTISWVNDDPGSTIVAIVDSDTVSMTASVDPFITVNIGSQATATACDGTFAGNGGTLALGSLSASTVTSSDASSVPHICIRVSTNAATGAVATVKSTNAALKSTSTPADTIDSATASPLATNTAGYGLCVGSAGGDTGRDSTTPTGALPTAASPFNGSCTSAVHNIGALTTGAQNVFTLSSPTQNAFARIYLKAGISTTTKAHTDYGDTLTFIVTGTF